MWIKNWIEDWIDEMGLIVALSGNERFNKIAKFKCARKFLSEKGQQKLDEAIRKRFTPSNGEDGCKTAMDSVKRSIN